MCQSWLVPTSIFKLFHFVIDTKSIGISDTIEIVPQRPLRRFIRRRNNEFSFQKKENKSFHRVKLDKIELFIAFSQTRLLLIQMTEFSRRNSRLRKQMRTI